MTQYSHDPYFGGLASETDPNGLTTSLTYDGFGRTTNATYPDGSQTNLTYVGGAGCPYGCSVYETTTFTSTVNGQATTVNAAPPAVSFYDLLERPVFSWQTSFDGTAQIVQGATTYNAMGMPLSVSAPYFQCGASSPPSCSAAQYTTPQYTTYLYDAVGRAISETRPDLSLLTTTYSANNVPVVTKTLTGTGPPSTGESTTTVLNSQGETVTATDALGHNQTYAYDPFGDMLTSTDPTGKNVTTMTYDARGHLTQLADPDRGTWKFAVDALGEVTQQTDGDGQVTNLSYDFLGRATQRSETTAGTSPITTTATWTYGTTASTCASTYSCGALTGATSTDTNGYTRSEFYDSLARPSKTAIGLFTNIFGGSSYTASTTYDGASRVATVTDPSGFERQYSYNPQGYPSQLANGSGAVLWTANTMDPMLHLTQATYGNGVVTAKTYFPTTGRLQSIMAGPAGSPGSVQSKAYSWDAAGNLLERSDSVNDTAELFTYDALNRLLTSCLGAGVTTQITSCPSGSTTTTIAYDTAGVGNIASKPDLVTANGQAGLYAYPAAEG